MTYYYIPSFCFTYLAPTVKSFRMRVVTPNVDHLTVHVHHNTSPSVTNELQELGYNVVLLGRQRYSLIPPFCVLTHTRVRGKRSLVQIEFFNVANNPTPTQTSKVLLVLPKFVPYVFAGDWLVQRVSNLRHLLCKYQKCYTTSTTLKFTHLVRPTKIVRLEECIEEDVLVPCMWKVPSGDIKWRFYLATKLK